MPDPVVTDRHRQLAERFLHAVDPAVRDEIAQLLAAEDVGRVPLAAVGASYYRGRGDVIRAVRAEIARPAPVESDVAFGLRLLRLLDGLEAASRPASEAFEAADHD